MAHSQNIMAQKVSDLQLLIAHTLRIGVGLAALIAAVGGIAYLIQHGSEAMPDYTQFDYRDPAYHPADYTTLGGIVGGIGAMNARSWIQLGVIALILTPVVRVVLSLLDFVRERDWLYAAITAVVLAVIIGNSLGIRL